MVRKTSMVTMPQSAIVQQLQRVFLPWGALNNQALFDELAALFSSCSLASNEFLAQPGDALNRVIIVVSGVLRFYLLDEDGQEWNKGFLSEDGITGPLAEYTDTWPNPYGLQALEKSMVLQASANEFLALAAQYSELDHVLRRYVSALLKRKAKRLTSFQRLDATGRYLEFCQEYAQVVERLPQYHIASFIGISEVSLSRLRRKLS